MNPFFYLLVLIFAVILWFLLSGAFVSIGSFIFKIWTKATGATNIEKDQKDQEENFNELR